MKKKSTVSIVRAPWPPPSPLDESEEERIRRQKEEEEAKRVSDEIDKAIGTEKEQKKKNSNAKILLLGMSQTFSLVTCFLCLYFLPQKDKLNPGSQPY